MFFRNVNNFKEYKYKLITDAASYPITKTEVKNLLKLDTSDTSEDNLLDILIAAVTDYAEGYTRRDFINKTYTVFFPELWDTVALRKSKLQSITHIKYYDNTDTLQTVSSSLYAITDDPDYSTVYTTTAAGWGTVVLSEYNPLPIQITFVAGYGADATYVPEGLKLAMLQHVAAMYANRGDCSEGGSGYSCESSLPAASRTLYLQYKIYNLNCRGA